jgi:hypothetical protein
MVCGTPKNNLASVYYYLCSTYGTTYGYALGRNSIEDVTLTLSRLGARLVRVYVTFVKSEQTLSVPT